MLKLKNPGRCVSCDGKISPIILVINASADACSRECAVKVQNMNIDQRIALILDKFVDSPELQAALEPFYQAKARMEDHIEFDRALNEDLKRADTEYMRPMGVPVGIKPVVFKPMKPSASIFIGGETDAEVAQNVLLVCWGTVAK
jgi:hypothetical protein